MEQELKELEALVEVMFLVASIDGDFSIPERRHFMDMVTSLSEGRLGSSELLVLIDRAHESLRQEGIEQRLAALKTHLVDDTARRLAYGLAAQLALVDGMNDKEKVLLDQMALAFELSQEDHDEIEASVRFASSRPPRDD